MTLALELAKRIHSLSFNALPADTVGVTLAGVREDRARIVDGVKADFGATINVDRSCGL